MSKDLALSSGLTVAGGTEGFRPPEQRRAGTISSPSWRGAGKIESIVVTDQTMELRLVITPLFDDGDPLSVFDLLDNGTGVNPTTLIDRANLKEYRVLQDGSHRYETDPLLARARAGESVGFQKFFAPPEDDIDVVDVKIHDDLPVFEDVPLTFEG